MRHNPQVSQSPRDPAGPRRRTPGGRAARIALRRSRAPGKGGGILVPLIIGIVVVFLLLVLSGVVIAGVAAVAVVDELGKDLPDVNRFETLDYAEPSRAVSRDGKQILATFFSEKRQVVAFRDIPHVVLDATTVVEDRTFWENQGVDLFATLAAVAGVASGSEGRGGGSTITQQFVRAPLLPTDLVADKERLYERKAKEMLQSYRLTQAFPGEDGKERIITAYLNQIFYGHNAYGISAAADVYFGARLACPREIGRAHV